MNNCYIGGGFLQGLVYPFENEFMGICLNLLRVEGGGKENKRSNRQDARSSGRGRSSIIVKK